MDKGEYGERLKRLNQYYARDDAHKRNFILRIADQLNLASEDGFAQLNAIVDEARKNCGTRGDPVKLVIIDNLTTLSEEGENPANFGSIEYALKSLKVQGIAVILIHHENKQGDIRGARKISDVMDMKLHLYKAEVEDKIGIIVKNEKIRSGKQSEFATFKAVLDVDAAGTGWITSTPSPEELKKIGEPDHEECAIQATPVDEVIQVKRPAWRLLTDEERKQSIIQYCQEGKTNAQIAEILDISRATVCAFRQEHSIRDCDLRGQVEKS